MKPPRIFLMGLVVCTLSAGQAQNSFLVVGGASSAGYRDGTVTPTHAEQSCIALFLNQAEKVGYQRGLAQTPHLSWSNAPLEASPVPSFAQKETSRLVWPFFQVGQLGSRQLHQPTSGLYQPFFRGVITPKESSLTVLDIIQSRKFDHFLLEFGVQDYWRFIQSNGREQRQGGLEVFALRYIQLLKILSSGSQGLVANLPDLVDISATRSASGNGFWREYQQVVDFQTKQAGVPIVDVRGLYASIHAGTYRTPQGKIVTQRQFFAEDQINLSRIGHAILANVFIDTWNEHYSPKIQNLAFDELLFP